MHVDGACVNAVATVVEAVDVYVSWIFLLNIEYPPELKSTLRFLCEVVAGFKCRSASLPSPVVSLLNRM